MSGGVCGCCHGFTAALPGLAKALVSLGIGPEEVAREAEIGDDVVASLLAGEEVSQPLAARVGAVVRDRVAERQRKRSRL